MLIEFVTTSGRAVIRSLLLRHLTTASPCRPRVPLAGPVTPVSMLAEVGYHLPSALQSYREAGPYSISCSRWSVTSISSPVLLSGSSYSCGRGFLMRTVLTWENRFSVEIQLPPQTAHSNAWVISSPTSRDTFHVFPFCRMFVANIFHEDM